MTPIAQATSEFLMWGMTAPVSKRDGGSGGYDKCDFDIEWVDGTKYEQGRFDLQKGGTEGGEGFRDSFIGRVHFYSGLLPTPHHMTEEQYAQLVMTDDMKPFRDLCRHILTKCEL